MIPMFSIFDSPMKVILFILVCLFCACVGALLGIELNHIDNFGKSSVRNYSQTSNIYMVLCSLLGVVFFIILLWLFIGDSFEWSEAFGLWLMGR